MIKRKEATEWQKKELRKMEEKENSQAKAEAEVCEPRPKKKAMSMQNTWNEMLMYQRPRHERWAINTKSEMGCGRREGNQSNESLSPHNRQNRRGNHPTD